MWRVNFHISALSERLGIFKKIPTRCLHYEDKLSCCRGMPFWRCRCRPSTRRGKGEAHTLQMNHSFRKKELGAKMAWQKKAL